MDKVGYSAHHLSPCSLILAFVRSAALLFSCVSALPGAADLPQWKRVARLGSSWCFCSRPTSTHPWVRQLAPADSSRVLYGNSITQGMRSCVFLAYFESQSYIPKCLLLKLLFPHQFSLIITKIKDLFRI